MEYQYSCISPKSLRELEYILEHSREITYQTFRRRIGTESFKELENNLGYSSGMKLVDDAYVSYYSSKLPNKQPVYFIDHSRIEYVFY